MAPTTLSQFHAQVWDKRVTVGACVWLTSFPILEAWPDMKINCLPAALKLLVSGEVLGGRQQSAAAVCCFAGCKWSFFKVPTLLQQKKCRHCWLLESYLSIKWLVLHVDYSSPPLYLECLVRLSYLFTINFRVWS